MPDITMCKNNNCPQVDNCWRYGCPPDKHHQSYQVFEPKQDDEEDFVCDFFIPYPNYDNDKSDRIEYPKKEEEGKESKTAMQELIEKMNEAKDNFPAFGFDEEFVRGFNKAFQMAVFITQVNGIPKEKKQIIDAHNKGISRYCQYDPERHGNEQPTGEQYYSQTYKS